MRRDPYAADWWDEAGLLYALHPSANPTRLEYVLGVLERELGSLEGQRVLDLGCGGGFVAEALAERGLAVSGVDPSAEAIEAARAHARGASLGIDYRIASGEALPHPSGSFDAVCCLDVLEHVPDLERVAAEAARVLRPGGLFVYDTVNRTWKSRLVVVHLLQDFPPTRIAPRLHDPRGFIRPAELRALLERGGLEPRETVGLAPVVGMVALAGLLWRCRRGELTPAEAMRRAGTRLCADTSVSYLGYAVKV